jgi:hypothetical protein
MEYRRSGGSILRKARQTTFPRIFQTKVRSRKTEQPLTGALVVQCFNSYCRFLSWWCRDAVCVFSPWSVSETIKIARRRYLPWSERMGSSARGLSSLVGQERHRNVWNGHGHEGDPHGGFLIGSWPESWHYFYLFTGSRPPARKNSEELILRSWMEKVFGSAIESLPSLYSFSKDRSTFLFMW